MQLKGDQTQEAYPEVNFKDCQIKLLKTQNYFLIALLNINNHPMNIMMKNHIRF
jgi:hypothetical protein